MLTRGISLAISRLAYLPLCVCASADAVGNSVALELLEDVGVTLSLSSEGIGVGLLNVTVTIEGLVGSVGDSVWTVVRAQIIDGGVAGVVEVALAVTSSVNFQPQFADCATDDVLIIVFDWDILKSRPPSKTRTVPCTSMFTRSQYSAKSGANSCSQQSVSRS